MKKVFGYILIFTILLGTSCAPSRIVRPLKKGEDRWGLSLGGPVMKYAGTVIPMPFTTISYAKAETDSLTWFASVHATSALFNNFQSEVGFCYNLYQKKNFKIFKDSINLGVSISPVANFAMHVNGIKDIRTEKYTINNPGTTFISGVKLWPQLDLNAHVSYGRKYKNFFYFGISNWFEVNRPYSYNPSKKPPFILCSPQFGNTWNDKKGWWSFTIEAKYLVPYLSNQSKVVDYIKPGKTGAIGIFFGFTKKIVHYDYDDN